MVHTEPSLTLSTYDFFVYTGGSFTLATVRDRFCVAESFVSVTVIVNV